MTDYALVLSREYPGREWSLNGNDYASLVIHDGGSKPTKAKLDSLWPKVAYELEYERVEAARRARYQAETDGLYFAAMREDTPNLATWRAAVDQIKADLPYPTPPEA